MNTAQDIKVGDIVLPPRREISLWMQRTLAEKGLSPKALELTVVDVREGKADKKGQWLVIKGQYSREWTKDYGEPERDYFMTFKARPQSHWEIL